MSNLRARAEALRGLLASEQSKASAQPLVNAAIDLCDELLLADEGTVALNLLEQARFRRDQLPFEIALNMDVTLVAALRGTGRYSEALELGRGIAARAETRLRFVPDVADRLKVLEGACLWYLNRPLEAIALLDSLRSRLLTRSDSPLLAECSIYLSSAHWTLGENDAATRLALDALVSARRLGNRYLEVLTLGNCAMHMRRECRWTEAVRLGEEALRASEVAGSQYLAGHAMRGLALLHRKRGHLEVALQWADRCLGGNVVLQLFGRLAKAAVLIHMGRLKEAAELMRDLPPWGPPSESRAALLASEYLADIQFEQGDVKGALVQYEEVYTKAIAIAPKGDIVGDLHLRRAECYLRLGRTEEAYAEAKVALEHQRNLGERYEEAATHRVIALCAAAVGRPDEAKKWFDEGFAYYDDIETPYEWGRLWLAHGEWLTGSHAGAYADRAGAIEAYNAARDLFERIGAAGRLAEATERLEALGEMAVPGHAGKTTSADACGSVMSALRATPRRPRRRTEIARRSAWALETFGLVTRNAALLGLLEDVAKLAPSRTPILLLGESGTGKELVAQGVQKLSRRKGAFLAINAGALPREIIESELFGHVAGSFTGALRDKPGIFEACDRGTVFLDEIAEMPVELQSRLLRFLETGEVRRLGANGTVAVDTRIVAATNRPQRELEQGMEFRTDLYYRLAHAVITLPPLRHRGEDLAVLIEHFLAESRAEAGREVRLATATRRRLLEYSWPGNVRQLKAILTRVVLLAVDGHEVQPQELRLHEAEAPKTLSEELEVEERRIVVEALAKVDGSHAEAARLLGVPRTTLLNKIRRFGLEE